MGLRDAKTGKRYLMDNFESSFYPQDTMPRALDKVNEICGDRKNKFLYIDFSIKFLFILSSARYFDKVQKKLTGSSIVYSMMKYIEKYCKKMDLHTVVVAIDGDHGLRPSIKVKRRKRGERVDASEVRVNDGEFNLTSESWIASSSDNKVREKVMGYISSELCRQWSEIQKFSQTTTDLVVDSVPVPDARGGVEFCAYTVSGGKIVKRGGCAACEGEQIIYHYLDKFSTDFPGSAHVVDGFTDTDHFSYCLLHQEKNPSASIVLKMNGLGDESKHYAVDIGDMRAGIAKMFPDGGALSVIKFVLLWGIAIGNDFTLVDSGKKQCSLRSSARGINASKLIAAGVRSGSMVLESGGEYRIDPGELRRVVASSAKFKMSCKGGVILREVAARSEWCINYFYNPGRAKYASYEEYRRSRKRKREGALGDRQNRKKIKT